MTKLKTFFSLSVSTFLLLLLVYLALPALFLLLRIPSFTIGSEPFWLLRWNNTTDGSGIQFNLLPLIAIALLVGLVGLFIKQQRD